MAPSQLERIEVLELTVADLIPREELTRKLDAAATAAGEARDVTTRLEVLIKEKIVPMVEEDHRTLRGHEREIGLVASHEKTQHDVRTLRSIVVWPLLVFVPSFIGFLAWIGWGLLTHRVIIEEVVATVTPH